MKRSNEKRQTMIYKTLHRNPKNKREIKQKRKSSVYIPETKAYRKEIGFTNACAINAYHH
jgi:hypothetical protein